METEVIIYVQGGIVQGAWASNDNINVTVVDADNIGSYQAEKELDEAEENGYIELPIR